MRFSKFLSPLFLLFLSSCNAAKFAVVNLPTYFDDVTVIQDISYGAEPEQKLDIYMPAGDDVTARDVMVFFYGGRWSYGRKEDYRFVGAHFARENFITVIVDYRKYPQVRFPVFVQDGAKALAWVYDNIAEYHGDPARVHVTGHSAGAHIGALLTADAHYLKDEGHQRSKVIKDFIGLSGPYAFTPDEPDLQDMFAPPQNYPLMQVPTFIDGHQPPMLLLYGDSDTDVKAFNLERLKNKIKDKGGCVQAIIYPKTNHIDIVAALSWINPRSINVSDDMVRFMRSTEKDKCVKANIKK